LSETQENTPFFVVSAPRSGSTLLRVMLNRHSRLCVPPESHFIPQLIRNFGEAPKASAFWQALRPHPRFDKWPVNFDALEARLRTVPADWNALFSAVFMQVTEEQGKARWGDKTPDYVQHVGLLHRVFPEAKFIHLVRDGRDVASSLLKVPWWEGSAARAARYWRKLVDKGRMAGRRLPEGHYLEMCYEHLVTEPEKTLREICAFLNESFEPAMLSYYESSDESVKESQLAWHENLKRPVTADSIGRWRRDLSPRDAGLCELFARDLLREYRYPIDTPKSLGVYARWVLWKMGKRIAKWFGRKWK
jgi:hypothetical protein